jgi:predicted porin
MKKSLLAVAAIGAFASAAQAQSSVTVYGILDVGFQGATQHTATTGQNGAQFGQSAEQTSRLGFKGTEDLGGGRQALFTAEFTLFPADATLSGNSAGGLQNRQAFVGIHQNGVGAATIGTQYTGIFNEAAATDPGQLNNVAGGLIYSVAGVSTAQGAQTISGVDGSSGANVGFTTRTSNTLNLQSDSFSGFRVNAAYVLNDQNQNQGITAGYTTGGMTNTNGWGLGADYTLNKFYATAQYQAFKNQTIAAGTSVNPNGFVNAQQGVVALNLSPAQTGTIQNGTSGYSGSVRDPLNVQDNQFYVAATYDFGILKAYAQYVNRKVSDTFDSNQYYKRQAEQIGVRSYITPTIEAWGSAGLGRVTAFGNNQPTANFNGWQLGSNYWLSKRTNLYAIYGAVNQTTAAYSGSTLGAANINQNGQQYAVGVRHTF